jgi:hypothetical protein
MTYKLTNEDILALRSYAAEFGKHWKQDLLTDWMKARTREDYGKGDRIPGRGNILHNLRNQLGPTWLDGLRLNRLMTSSELKQAKLAYFDEVPEWQHRGEADLTPISHLPKWSSDKAPPAIGETVTTNVYNRDGFKARVTGYFTQDGWLGVTADLLDPPEAFTQRQDGDPRVHLFGAEIS